MHVHLRARAAGKIKPMKTVAVAPVNWKASQMLGMKFAAKKMSERSIAVMDPNLPLSDDKGLDDGKSRPSKLSRSAKKIMGNTSIMWRA